MTFECNSCGSNKYRRTETRGDGKRVLFCAECEMGIIENPPSHTDIFYRDGYYGTTDGKGDGYHDYELTAAHTQLWVQLFIEAHATGNARVLDIGCADGTMLGGLPSRLAKWGIEANATAAARAAERGITIIANDIANEAVLSEVGKFEVVSSIATFEHVLDMRGAVEIALQLLRPEGILILEVPVISDTADNTDWLQGSYEHISYPTIGGLTYLFDSFPDVNWTGFESQIKGFSSSYIAVLSRSAEKFDRAKQQFEAMRATGDISAIPLEMRRLNIAFRLVHGFDSQPELVLALPDLFSVARSEALLKRLSQIWYADCLKARNAEYHEQQARQWQQAWRDSSTVTEALEAELKRLTNETGGDA